MAKLVRSFVVLAIVAIVVMVCGRQLHADENPPRVLTVRRPSTGDADLPPPVDLKKKIATLNASGMKLIDVIDQIREQSDQRLFVNWVQLKTKHVTKELPITCDFSDLPVGEALKKLLKHISGKSNFLEYVIDENVITISTSDDFDRETQTQTYDIRKAIKSKETHDKDVENLLLRVQGIAPLSWRSAGGQIGAVAELSGQLIVTQSPEIQQAIAKELADILPPEHNNK